MRTAEMIAPRNAFGNALVELGEINDEVVVFDSDVGESTQASRFGKAYPDRFYQMGIAEANMVCAAAGMSTLGYIPWVSTFAVFLAKRAVDQIRVFRSLSETECEAKRCLRRNTHGQSRRHSPIRSGYGGYASNA